MGILENPSWELYARELVEIELAAVDPHVAQQRGELRHQAYKKAGYDGNIDNARRLANHRKVRARFRELFKEALEYRDVRVAQVVTRIDRVGRANIADMLENDGKTFKNIKELPPELTAAIESVEVADGKVKVKLLDKNQANFTLLKHLGGVPADPGAGATNVNILGVLSVEDQRTLANALKALPGGPSSSDREIGREHSAA